MRLLFSFNFKSTLKIQERQGGKVDFLARGSHSSAVTSLQPKKAGFFAGLEQNKGRCLSNSPLIPYGAENEIRTRDPHLGKVMLYH